MLNTIMKKHCHNHKVASESAITPRVYSTVIQTVDTWKLFSLKDVYIVLEWY